jgi:hypothetical protein
MLFGDKDEKLLAQEVDAKECNAIPGKVTS